MGPFRIGENGTLADWVKWAFPDWDPSGLVKKGPFRVSENGTVPDWDPSGLVKTGPFRIGENGTFADWRIGSPPDW